MLQNGQDIRDRGDLAVGDEHIGIIHDGFHLVRIRHHVRRDVAAIELHALDDGEVRVHGLGLLNRDDAVLADLLHCLCDELADLGVRRGDRRDLRDLCLRLDLLCLALDLLDQRLDRHVDALLDDHRVRARHDVAHALLDHRLCEERRRRRAVARDVVRLRRNFLHELCAHVLERILELDVACNRHAVIRDRRRTILLIEDDVASLRAKRYLDRICQCINTAAKSAACLFVKQNLLCHLYCLHVSSIYYRIARMSLSRTMR